MEKSILFSSTWDAGDADLWQRLLPLARFLQPLYGIRLSHWFERLVRWIYSGTTYRWSSSGERVTNKYLGTRLVCHFQKVNLQPTVAHNCHIKTKCSQQIKNRSHQIQIAHIKFKLLTANSNRSQQIKNRSHQIQIAHSELQITHSKLQVAHSKFKSPTANSNRSQQIKVAHSKFNCSHQITNKRLRLSTASGYRFFFINFS